MAREQMLLDRIAALQSPDGIGRYEATAGQDLEALMESVRRNLIRLLNARQQMAKAVPEYGLPAMSDVLSSSDNYVRQVQDAIRGTIERYEPRLRNVRVSPVADRSDKQTLVFRVDAVLVAQDGQHRVWYETAFTPSGRMNVAG